EPQHVSDHRHGALGALDARVAGRALADPDEMRAAADVERGLERPRGLVAPVGQQIGDAVRGERALEVDGLAAGAYELDLLHVVQDVRRCGWIDVSWRRCSRAGSWARWRAPGSSRRCRTGRSSSPTS